MSAGFALSLLANLLLVVGLGLTLWHLKRHRETRKQRGLLRPWPIPQIDPDAFDPRFATNELGPSVATEIRFIAGFRVPGGTSDFEAWILANFAKNAQHIFEFGTATGKTTYLLAANALPSARVTTLTLAPGQAEDHRLAPGDGAEAMAAARAESVFTRFFYDGTPEVANIEQHFGDSKGFDETPYVGRCDLVFIDGSHARSYVESDSRKALAMLKPGGVALWHDYRGPRRTAGVFEALNELSRELPLVHLKGTSLVAYRKPL